PELLVGAEPAPVLEVDAEPVRVLLRDLAERGLEALLHPRLQDARLVLGREGDEELELVGVVVEDRAAREADLVLEPADGRALVAVPGERPPGAREDLLAAGLKVLFGAFRHGLYFTKPYGRFIISAVLKNRSAIALLAAELVSTTGIQMTFVALPWFVL